MNFDSFKNLSKIKAYRTKLVLKKHSPEIFLVTGIGGSILSTILACVATYKKLPSVLEKAEDVSNSTEAINWETRQEYLQAKAIIGLEFIVELVKVYGLSFTVAMLSYGMLVRSNRILNRRNAAIVSAYALVDAAFKQYRKRVKEELGSEVDEYFRWKKPLGEKMKIVSAEKKVNSVNFDDAVHRDLLGELIDEGDRMGMPSQYARIFDSSSVYWRRDRAMNDFFLTTAQSQLNDKLNAQGHLFLNEAYDTLGIPRSEAGAVVGWVADGNGDNFVDIDIFNPRNEINRDYINGYQEDAVILDFNVDGIILDIFA